MKICLIFLCAIFLFSSPLLAAEETPSSAILTFQEFARKVLVYYPKLKQQDADVSVAIAKKAQAFSGFLPRVWGGMSVARGDDPIYVFGSLLRQDAFTADDNAVSRMNSPRPRTNVNFSIEGQVPIFDAFQTISKVRSAKLLIGSARDNASFVKMEALLVATEAYLKAVAVENLLATARELRQASEEDIKQAEDLKDKGLILGADFFAAKVMLGRISQFANQLAEEKKAAHMILNILMGEDPLRPVAIRVDLPQGVEEAKGLGAWFEEAYKSRLDLASLDKAIEAQGVDVSREKASGLPRVDAFGEARQDAESFSSDGGQNYVVGVKAQVPLFDPAFGPRVRQSRGALEKLRADKLILKDRIAQDLAYEYARYEGGWNNLPVTEQVLQDAGQAVDLMLPLYREGRKSIADLLEIRTSFLDAARARVFLSTDIIASWARLLFLSGQLDEARVDGLVRQSEASVS